ncbi:MAG: hypothetical protein IPK87_17400 [Planctomycetes bacterium]|nr:hypothetical protein [Planctomycetota bacterium]
MAWSWRSAMPAPFSPAYQDDIEPAHALEDIEDLEALAVDARRLRLNLYFPDLKQRAKNGGYSI